MATRILTPFEQQNVDYGFSPDVQPSSLSLRRAAPLPTPYKPLRVDQPRSRGGMRGKPYLPAVTTPQSRPQGPEYRLGPRGVAYGPKDLGTVKNDYAQGGDGTVAREAAPEKQTVNIGGVPRDELIRRMENASLTMRGSPTARAAVMGMYADSVKAIDQGELDKNKGNIESDQLAYRGNMDANMQESRGRQEFGNNMGLMIRKGEIDAKAAAALSDPEKRAAEIEKIKSDTAVNEATALMRKGEYEAAITGKQDAAITSLAKELYAGGKGKYATMDDALAAATNTYTAGGNPPRGTTFGRGQDNALTDQVINRLGKDSFVAELFTKGWSGASFGQSEQVDPNKVYSADDLELQSEDSWANTLRTNFFGQAPIQTLKIKGSDAGYGDPTARLLPNDPEDAKIIDALKIRRRAVLQSGQ